MDNKSNCDKLRCGGIKKFIVIKQEDADKYLKGDSLKTLRLAMADIATERLKDGKRTDNEYLVINTDEPYINEIIEILKCNGHWG